MYTTKKEFMQSAVPMIFGFLLVEDRMAWYKDPGTYGNSNHELASNAIDAASVLWEAMSNHGLLDEDNRSTDYTHLAAQ